MNLLGVCLLAFSATLAYSAPSWETGKTYTYDYKGYTVSGVPLSTNERVGLAMWSKVLISIKSEDTCIMQLQKPTVREVILDPSTTLSVDTVPCLETALERTTEFPLLPEYSEGLLSKFIEKPVQLKFNSQGQIVQVKADPNEPEWILTLKNGIYSKFQLPRNMEKNIVKITENTMMGKECEVDYDVMVPREESTNTIITQRHSLDSCRHPSVHDDLVKLGTEPRKDSGEGDLRSSFVTTYNVTRGEKIPFIHDCVTEGRYTMSIFQPNHGEAVIYTRQEMKHIKTENKKLTIIGVESRRDSVTPPMIMDTMHDVKNSEPIKVQLIRDLFTEIGKSTESETEPTFEVVMSEKYKLAVSLMNNLHQSESFEKIVDFATKKENKMIRQMIMMALSNCHSKGFVQSLTTIQSKVENDEMANIIRYFGIHANTTLDVIRTLKTLYGVTKDNLVKQQILLSIGSQIYQLCRPHRGYGTHPIKNIYTCSRGFQDEFSNFFVKVYTQNRETTTRLTVLKAVGNSGLEMSKMLKQYIEMEDTSMDLRVNAIYAMRRNHDIESVLNVLMPLYRRHTTPVELRIAAFNTLIDIEPTSEMLVSLVSHLNDGRSMQLGNYVYSYLDTMVQIPTTYAATKNLSMTAQNLLPTVRRFEGGVWYSQNRQFFFHTLGLKVFRHLETSLISTPQQAIPRSGLLRFTREYCGYFLKAFEMGFRMEGADTFVESLYKQFFATEDLLPGRSFVKDLKKVHSILIDDKIKSEDLETPEGHIFFKVLGSELGSYRFNEETFTDLSTTIFEKLMTLGKNRIFNVQSLFPVELKAQTPMGVPMFSDVSLISMTSIHTDDSKTSSKSSLWTKDVTFRNLLKSRIMFGVRMGPWAKAFGSCKHLKTVLPHTWEVSLNSKTSNFELEVFWNVEDPVFKSKNPTDFHLVQLHQIPINYNMAINPDKRTVEVSCDQVKLHPLLKTSEERYTMDFTGHKLSTIEHVHDWTLVEPASPYDGRHIITLGFYDNKVKPFGIKIRVDSLESKKNDKLGGSLKVELNPRVPQESKTVEINLYTMIENSKTSEPTPELVLEVNPEWMNMGTYRIIFHAKELKGRDNQEFRWLEAGEDFDIEKLFGLQYGWDEKYDTERQDFLLKYRTSKSELQKFFEREDKMLEGSDCNRCEQIKQTEGVWTNINCERCLLKRQTRTEKTYTLFLNNEKMGSKWVEKLMKYMDEANMEHYNIFESKHSEKTITPELINEESELVNKYMNKIDESKIEAFKRVEQITPSYTECNITSWRGEKMLRFSHVPLYPSERRLDNLPLDRLTDVWLQRLSLGTEGVCHIDTRNVVKTMDGVVYPVPQSSDCQRILAKDCSTTNSFEIRVSTTKDSNRMVTIQLKSRNIQITPTKDSFTVVVDSKTLPMEPKTINGYKYEVFGSGSLSGYVEEIEAPENKKVKELRLDIGEIYTTVIMIEDYVKLEVPFWYKNRICGLCGDFNTERVMELKLPNKSVVHDLKTFLESYSNNKCNNEVDHHLLSSISSSSSSLSSCSSVSSSWPYSYSIVSSSHLSSSSSQHLPSSSSSQHLPSSSNVHTSKYRRHADAHITSQDTVSHSKHE